MLLGTIRILQLHFRYINNCSQLHGRKSLFNQDYSLKSSVPPAISSIRMTSATITMTPIQISNGGSSVTGYILYTKYSWRWYICVKSDSLTTTIAILTSKISELSMQRETLCTTQTIFCFAHVVCKINSGRLNLTQSAYRFHTSILVQWDPQIWGIL